MQTAGWRWALATRHDGITLSRHTFTPATRSPNSRHPQETAPLGPGRQWV